MKKSKMDIKEIKEKVERNEYEIRIITVYIFNPKGQSGLMKGEEVKEVREMHNYGDCSFCQYRGKLYIFQNRYKNEELSYYCHTDHALPITHYPSKEIFKMTKAALITGISGQDGAYLARFLLDKGYEVFGAYRRLSTPNFWRLQYLDIFESVNLIPSDLIDAGSMLEAVKISEPVEIL
jgi:hypothetical protein